MPQKSKLGIWLWILAFFMMAATSVYQRRTGPTHPLRGSTVVGEQKMAYRLPRSATNTKDAKVVIPDPSVSGFPARVLWRRYPTDEPFTVAIMAPETDGQKKILTANLPAQPAAGKVEYKIEIANSVIPDNGDTVVLRYKGPVSPLTLVPHILLIFAAMLVSTRAGLGAAFGRHEKKLPWVSLSLILVGGLVLGMLVQKAAFGAYWTGWPYGSDLTDNKTLVMFLAWLVACLLFRLNISWLGRVAVISASVITLGVYLIPHSLRGSQLDYKEGVVRTGQSTK